MDCLFCKIIKGEIPSKKVYEDDLIYAFEDISPQAPVHILVVPKKHISGIPDLTEADDKIIGHLFRSVNKIAEEKFILDTGFRTVINSGKLAGQEVFHIHIHLLGGRVMTWPPG